MLDTEELKRLTRWCTARSMHWRPLLRGGELVVLIEPSGRAAAWQRMVLTQAERELELATASGDLLASATDLESVLDVLDGGIGEPVHEPTARAPATRAAIGAMVI